MRLAATLGLHGRRREVEVVVSSVVLLKETIRVRLAHCQAFTSMPGGKASSYCRRCLWPLELIETVSIDAFSGIMPIWPLIERVKVTCQRG